jgi:hypothetical protein
VDVVEVDEEEDVEWRKEAEPELFFKALEVDEVEPVEDLRIGVKMTSSSSSS